MFMFQYFIYRIYMHAVWNHYFVLPIRDTLAINVYIIVD